MMKKSPTLIPERSPSTNAERAAEARARTERLKAALKENMGRRKAQTRARKDGEKADD